MIYLYIDMLEEYGSAYQINKAVDSGVVFKVSRGVYSNERHPDPNAIVCVTYPKAILTMDSAFCLHGLTDVVPEKVHVATARNSTRIKDPGIRQYFMETDLMTMGVQTIESAEASLRLFSRERMLVELLRCANSLPLDYYKELIGSYRKLASSLDMREVEECIALFKRSDTLFERLQREVL